MTTLVAWVACDNAKQTAVYLASDSRLSWNKNTRWDRGRKIFSSEKYADIFGYCGDVLFCSQQLSQIISYIDSCKTFENKFQPCERSEIIFDLVKNSFGTYPKEFVLPTFSIIYLTRHEKYDFHGYLFSWNKSSGWSKKKLNIGDKSSLITVQGSGARGFKSLHANKIATSDYGTNSRGYFYALNRFIDKAIDTATGGPPQISCIYNIGGAMTIGVICKGERYVFGLNIPPSEEMNDIRWVNNKFESCDGKIMKKKKTAQAQPIPTKLLGKEPT